MGDVDLAQIFCEKDSRLVGRDNVLSIGNLHLQLRKQPGRPTCAGLRVLVRRHLDGFYTVWRGPQCLGRYTPTAQFVAPRVVERSASGRFRLAAAQPLPPRPTARRRRGLRLPIGPGLLKRTDHVSKPSGHFTCQQQRQHDDGRPPRRPPAGGAHVGIAGTQRRP